MTKITFIMYTADWCQPCKIFKEKYLHNFIEKYPEVVFKIVNIEDTDRDVSHISSIPYVTISDGEEVIHFSKVLSQIEEIDEVLDEFTE